MLNLHRWPLFIPLLSAITGLALARTDMLDIYLAVILLLFVVIALLIFRQRAPALMLAAGALWGAADLLWDASQLNVDAGWLNGDMEISAEIEQVQAFSGYQRYRLAHISRDDGVLLPGKALLYQHSSQHRGDDSVQLQAGQRIRARVHWRLPRNYRNPGAFDYRAWCFDRHIALIGSIKGKPEIIEGVIPWLEQQRQKVRTAIDRANRTYKSYATYKPHPDYQSHSDSTGVLRAVLLGERSQISSHANDVFATTGTAHLLAISGMHIGMAATWVFALVWFVLTRRESWIVRLSVRNISMVCGFLAATAYATMAGWPLPAIRATIMLAAAALGWCLSARSEPVNTLLAALGLILLFDPTAIASLSLWLSFVATAALLLWAGKPEREEAPPWGKRLMMMGKSVLWISLLATLATLPLIVSTFGRIPVYSLPANLMMVPLYALIVMPAGLLAELFAIFGLDSMAAPLMSVAGMAVEAGVHLLAFLSNLPAGRLWTSHPPVWAQCLYMGGMACCGVLLWRDKRFKAVLSAVLIMAIWLTVVLHETDIREAQWVVWDVGQGAASTLLLPDKLVIAVDAPGRRGSRFNGGTTEAAGLSHLGITHIDVLALTHAQSDHMGGALSLIKHLNRVGQVWLPDVPSARTDVRIKAIVTYAEAHGVRVRWLAQGDEIQLGGGNNDWPGNDFKTGGDDKTTLSVLWPPRSFDPSNTNNTSLVLAVRLPDQTRLLWPGDIEAAAEAAIVAAGVENTDAMLMPHHGSTTSSRQYFLNALVPKLAIAQTGFANRYGFPKAAVLKRYRAMDADVRNTANGAVLIRWTDGHASVETRRPDSNSRRELALHWWRSWREDDASGQQ